MKVLHTINNPMPPLWMMFPELPQASMGWRMGYGESYSIEFMNWFKELSSNEKQQYQHLFPAPKMWRGFYDEFSDKGFDIKAFKKYFLYGVQLWNQSDEPQYSKEKIINEQQLRSKSDFAFFWHNGNDIFDCFSQWRTSNFQVSINRYSCCEQYMMAEKARIFDDEQVRKKIMETTDPMDMKILGRQVKKFRDKKWDKVKYSVVLNANYYKFTQNKEMREILLDTGNKIIVEASPTDMIWGIGFVKEKPEATNPKLWRGENLLGFALMEVRDEIKKVYENYDKIDWRQFEKYR